MFLEACVDLKCTIQMQFRRMWVYLYMCACITAKVCFDWNVVHSTFTALIE